MYFSFQIAGIQEWLRKQDFDAVVITRGKCVTQSDQTKDKTKLFTFHGLKRELGPKGAKAHKKLAEERGRAGPVCFEVLRCSGFWISRVQGIYRV
jgi:hypothetical protein